MTVSNSAALPPDGRHDPSGPPGQSVAQRLAVRQRRTRAIRQWVVACAVTLFLALAVVIIYQTRVASTLVSTSASARSAVVSSASGSVSSSTASSSGTSAPVTTSQS